MYDPRYHLNSETFYGSIPQNLSALMVQDFFGPIPFSVTGEPGEAYLPSGDGFGPRLREGFGTSSAKAFTGRLLSAASEMLTVSFQRLFVKKDSTAKTVRQGENGAIMEKIKREGAVG